MPALGDAVEQAVRVSRVVGVLPLQASPNTDNDDGMQGY
jgi:hypothetical protein